MFSRLKIKGGDKSLFQRLLKGTLWTFLGVAVSRSAGFISNIFVARILGVLLYGKFSIISDTVTLLGSVAGLSLGITATRFIAEYKQEDKKKAGAIISLILMIATISSLIFTLGLLVTSNRVSADYLNDPQLSAPLRIGAFLLFFNVIESVLLAVLLGFEEFKKIALRNFIVAVITIPLTLAGVRFYGMNGVLSASVLIKLAATVLNIGLLRKILKTHEIELSWGRWKGLRGIFGFIIPAFLSGIILQVANWYMKSRLTQLPDGYVELGYYSTSHQIMSIVIVLSGVLSTAILPIFVSSMKEKNKTFEKFNILISWSVGIFLGLPVLYFPQILELLYGQAFYTDVAVSILIVTILTLVLIQYKEGLARVLIARKLMKFSLVSNLIWCVVALALSAVLMPSHGALGMAWAILAAYVINICIMIPYYIRKKIAPTEVMFSRETMMLWGLLIFSGVVSYLNLGPLINSGLLAVNIALILWLFVKIFKNRDEVGGDRSAPEIDEKE